MVPLKEGVPLSFNEGKMLEVLSESLQQYLSPEQIQHILSTLRNELYSGIDLGTLAGLHSITKSCRKCKACLPEAFLPWWNRQDPDLVFVIESPNVSPAVQDLLRSTFKEQGFSSSKVCVTFMNRCKTDDTSRKHNADEISNCKPFLHTELQLMQPKLIVPMGLATSLLFLGSSKLADERGRIHWIGPWAVMPTYGPGFVLRDADKYRPHLASDLKTAYHFVYGDN